MGRPGLIAQITFHRRIEELTAVVAVKSLHRKPHAGLDPAQTNANFSPAVAPKPGQLRPAGVDVGEGQTPHELTAAAASAVRNRVRFQPARSVNLPRPAANRNGGFEPMTRAAATAPMTPAIAELVRGGDAVELPHAALENFVARRLR